MSPLVSQALDLVFYGMGTVFVFLSVLVLMTISMSALLSSKGFSSKGFSNRGLTNQGIGAGTEGQSVDPKLIAAISAAVKRHRHSKQ
ncbi:MAG: oxaloacetate decarboxylase gamma subunit [Candidatus Azotimanducaceae bacterium]|jgi:oxaloacetate decarboxylase gamma subunit